jgi:hypothetical protein
VWSLTFELRRPRRRGAWAAEPMICPGGSAAQAPRRWGSPLERGVRPHRDDASYCLGTKMALP